MTRVRTLTLLLAAACTVSVPVVPVLSGVPAGAAPARSAPSAPSTPSAPPAVLILHTGSASEARSPLLRASLARLGVDVRHTFGRQQAVSVALPAGTDGVRAASRVAALPGVTAVEHPVVRTFSGVTVPDDPRLASQRRYLDAVRAPAAWSTQHGSAGVRIAVIDSGVDVGHPDLAGKIVGTYNADTGRAAIPDTVGHGTFVAGVAAASTDNATGIAGAGFDTSILGVKVADRWGDISIDDEVAGIRWAADHGADVINLSLSGPEPSTAERQAVAYAQSRGALVVAAAGNEDSSARQYPAAYPGVIAVGATDVARHRRAAFSSYGPWVTLAAPGVGLLSTTPRAGSDYFGTRSGYARGDGTSFSSPLVAGAAALLKAQNPHMSASAIRAALVASAHGYRGSGLGRGQVDFAAALRHVTPVTLPSVPATRGIAGTIRFTALSGAPRVAFRVDTGPVLPSVPVVGGTATLPWSSYGAANGTHTLTAVDCSAYGECRTGGIGVPFVVANVAPALTGPAAGATVSGAFTATATGPGGGTRLLVDGTAAAFDRSAPYSFAVNATRFRDGPHTLTVRTCSTAARCDGPTSSPVEVVFDSLHPSIAGLTRTRISPNGDGSGDAAVLTIALPEPQDVAVETRSASGAVVRRDSLGALAAGRHRWTWRGIDRDRHRLRDGSYTLAVVTSRTVGGTRRSGVAGRSVVVDTVAPRLRDLRGNGVRFYPVHDGYRDTFRPSAVLPDGGTLRLAVRSASGRAVRTITAAVAPGARTAPTWDGRTRSGRVVRAGTYRWTFSVADRAGNVRRSATRHVIVSAARLRTRTADVVLRADSSTDAGGTARCAGASRSRTGGLLLVNRCTGASDDSAFARYSFVLPRAHRYDRMRFAVRGRSSRTSEFTSSFRRTDGALEIPERVTITPGRARWHTIAAVAAGEHVFAHRRVTVTLILGSHHAGRNDLDASRVRLRVVYTALV